MALDPDRVVKELEAAMNSQWFEDRPFLREFAEGRVPLERLARFSPSYLFQVDQFKRFVAAIYANAEPRDVRELMLENLVEEHGEGDPSRDHVRLVERFVRATGARVPDIFRVEPIAESRRWVERILAICREEPFVVGLAALSYGIEARTRTMSYLGTIYAERYGIPREDLEFFFLHVEADEEHAGRAIDLIRRYCADEALLERCVWAVHEVLDATRAVAEGMERVCAA